MTPPEFCERYRISEATARDWRYRRVGPPFLKVGKHVRYRLSDCEEWESKQLRATGVNAQR